MLLQRRNPERDALRGFGFLAGSLVRPRGHTVRAAIHLKSPLQSLFRLHLFPFGFNGLSSNLPGGKVSARGRWRGIARYGRSRFPNDVSGWSPLNPRQERREHHLRRMGPMARAAGGPPAAASPAVDLDQASASFGTSTIKTVATAHPRIFSTVARITDSVESCTTPPHHPGRPKRHIRSRPR